MGGTMSSSVSESSHTQNENKSPRLSLEMASFTSSLTYLYDSGTVSAENVGGRPISYIGWLFL